MINNNENMITKDDLIDLGFKPTTATEIIHQARGLLTERGFTFYNRKRLMVVPKSVVSEILATEL
ncbi:DUF3173 domain-containing protein [Pseudolactococcus yaeyamensis]